MFSGGYLLLVLLFTGHPLHAQWQVLSLHPAHATSSRASDVAEGVAVGHYRPSGAYNDHPILWNLETGESIDLLPEGLSFGEAYATD